MKSQSLSGKRLLLAPGSMLEAYNLSKVHLCSGPHVPDIQAGPSRATPREPVTASSQSLSVLLCRTDRRIDIVRETMNGQRQRTLWTFTFHGKDI